MDVLVGVEEEGGYIGVLGVVKGRGVNADEVGGGVMMMLGDEG